MKFIYNEIKDTRYKEVIPVNSKQEALLYEGRQQEDGVSIKPYYVNITEINTIGQTNKFSDLLNEWKANQVLANLNYQILKENMIEGAVAEMVFLLNNKLHWLVFRIERSIEYSESSDQIPNDVQRDLIFLVKEYDRTDEIPEDTLDGSIIYMKEYSYITI